MLPIFKESKDHTTYINSKGIIVPSVTSILKLINKEELLYWANSLGFRRIKVESELSKSAIIGTTAHGIIEKFTTTGVLDMTQLLNLDNELQLPTKKAIASFSKFYMKERANIKILFTEKILNGCKFGGTLDLLCEYNGKLTLADYKTSKSFYSSMFLQMGGYDILLKELLGIKVDQYMVILLDKKSGNEARTKMVIDCDEMKMYRLTFRKLLSFYLNYVAISQQLWND